MPNNGLRGPGRPRPITRRGVKSRCLVAAASIIIAGLRYVAGDVDESKWDKPPICTVNAEPHGPVLLVAENGDVGLAVPVIVCTDGSQPRRRASGGCRRRCTRRSRR